MRYFLIVLLAFPLFAANISKRYMVANNCIGCHKWVVDKWKTSWHSRSHYSKDPLYKATLQYMSKKLHRPLEAIEIKCAQCHNPRMDVKRMSEDEIISRAVGIGDKKTDEAINAAYVKDGINCIVCHNIKEIKESHDPDKRGYKSIVWGPNDTMVGPFADAKSPYHKTMQADHFLHPNKLCFVCHYNGRNKYHKLVYETGMEYEHSGSTKQCVECHMSEKRERRLANIVVNGSLPKIRAVRDHLFMGARNGDILQKALDVKASVSNGQLTIHLINRTPHRVPTGFAGRMIVIEAHFGNTLKKKMIKTEYHDRKGRITVPYLGKKKVFDNRILPNEDRVVTFDIPSNHSQEILIKIYYRLINDDLEKKLKVKDPIFHKNYPIANLKLKI
ncbi:MULTISPECIES: multiheme c-type cytochrome [unclassified Nitratiruptor]|uniref:multiheme c-type cytochrome n=1 Tax=unclassified Nitratiruptor TaxID=2624044 RepID=UPI0019161AF5|nr:MULTISPECIES: multiheme c-type cytochrome [unclassified Nitratiruptor]BCD59693.1 hypothetical protein NitYY0810_C0445 [Nitratiruptor sp. YY08-10]BCD63617.1 hypothetical protein NitYY0814_C0445 [Nitratiruptor sp. YY08-14]